MAESSKGVKGENFKFTWNRAKRTYQFVGLASKASCTVATADSQTKEVPNGYLSSDRVEYTFAPGAKGKTPSLTGTRTTTLKGTPEGAAAGCTDHEVTSAVFGTPTGTTAGDVAIAGKYTVTEVVDTQEPANQRPRGFTGILIADSAITTSGSRTSISGFLANPAGVDAGCTLTTNKGFVILVPKPAGR